MFLVKVPGLNSIEDTSGCRNSGNHIIKELRDLEINEQGKIINVNAMDIEEIHVDNSDLKNSEKLIYENSLEIFSTKSKIAFLGGDHSITFSIMKAFLKNCSDLEKDPFLIVFDSRPNCIGAAKNEFADNKNWLRKLVESGFKGKNILLVGTRKMTLEETSFIKENGINLVNLSNFAGDLQETCDFIMEFSNKKETYISIDMSVLDPSFAPSATFQDSGGFTSREIIYLIQRLNKIKGLKAFDIVEINSESEGSKKTLSLGSKILSEIV